MRDSLVSEADAREVAVARAASERRPILIYRLPNGDHTTRCVGTAFKSWTEIGRVEPPELPEIVVRVLDCNGVALTPLAGAMPSLATALRHASTSGYAPASGVQGYPDGVRAGRVWIEDRKKPATASSYERRRVVVDDHGRASIASDREGR